MAKVVKCVICGEPFVQMPASKRTCSPECAMELHRRSCRNRRSNAGIRSVKAERKAKAESRRAFLARRDAEYAAHAAPVTVEQRQFRDSELGMVMRRVETRGNRFCGSLSGVHRQLVTDYGVVYVA